ncbi:ATP-binding protein [Actinomadura macrotermitis]|uniref:OmpR/PhoB-type domain-containing protein n=1 Tax=Actinomadura macrotermitis TaxID=2585200 RepID=A0A7K0C447_9ACTN|nr:hypothetical protein [Actinomadura macrotermitis]
MRIGILGPVEVTAGGRPVEIGGTRLRVLLTLLALEAGRPVPSGRLIDSLWGEQVPAAAPNALQSLVSRLRTVIGREYLESRAGAYRLVLPPEAVDAHDFEARLARARALADPADRARELREALALWRGPALADAAGQPFAEGPAVRLEGLRRAALLERLDADLALGRHAALIPELEALTRDDPLSEPLRARLMRALYASGRQADALAQYESARAALADALGVDPSPELRDVHLAVLRHDADLTPAAPADGPRGNLPTRLTSFIGRDEDLKQVAGLLEEGRLVTLTGPGGAGKTRLSLESGERLAGSAPDGVWFVGLAPVEDPAEVPSAVLTALGLRETVLLPAGRGRLAVADAGDPLDRLAAALRGKRLLLLLDNCEHLLDAAARLADRLLAGCPGVRILATSREPLGITGETLWPVEPLEPPPPDAGTGTAAAYPAVRLFADRAVAVSPRFAVTGANVADVVRICRALDGMPLAIELAAARLRAMSPAQIAARLGDRFRLLNAGSRTALPRHQTLRAVVEWSWDLLDGPERALWRRLAVFHGGATLEAAEEVCAGPELDRADVLDVLAALVDKSLVLTDTAVDPPRYRMLETIRAYGLERLAAAGEEEAVRRRHAAAMVGLAEAAEPHLFRAGQLEWLARLAADHDNLQAALRWAAGTGDAALAVRFCAALGWYWFLHGRLGEASENTTLVLAMPGLPADQTTAVAFAVGAMTMLDSQRPKSPAGDWLRRSSEIAGELAGEPLRPVLRLSLAAAELYGLGWDEMSIDVLDPLMDDPDPWVRGIGHFIRAQFLLNFARTEELAEQFGRALANFREAGDRWGLSFTMTGQAELLGRAGRYAEAAALYRESIRLASALGGTMIISIHAKLANVLDLAGDGAGARALLAEAFPAAERRGTSEDLALLHYQYGEFARRAGDLEEARRRLARAEELVAHLIGPPQFRAMVLTTRALTDLASGAEEQARQRLAAALRDAVTSLDYPITAQVLAGYAALALHDGDPERAAVLLGTADAVRGACDLSLADALETGAAARDALGAAAFEAAHARGATRTFDDVLTEFGVERPSHR